MKKFQNVLMLICASSLLVSCGGNNSNPDTIKMNLTPSKQGVDLSNQASELKPILEKLVPGKKFEINVGTSFAADATGLASGSIDASFITSSAFALNEIQNPGKVNVILRATRDGFKVIADNKDSKGNATSAEARAKQLVAMNSGNYHGEAEGVASYYYAICITTKEKAKVLDKNADGKVTLEELAGHNIGMMGTASPAGYSYPRYAFTLATNNGSWKNGMTMVTTGNPDASKGEYKYVQMAAYETGFNDLMTGSNIDAMWGYMDIRNDAFSKWSAWKNNSKVWDDTVTIALTQPILNDGVAVRSNLDKNLQDQIANAFIQAAKTGDIKDDGKGANDVDHDGKPSPRYVIYSIYSHTGYEKATNDDYKDEIAFQKWMKANVK